MSPLLVSFDSVQTGVFEIPFPALTICNINKVRKSRVRHIDEELEKDPNSTFYLTEKKFVEEVCAKHENIKKKEGATGHEEEEENLNLSGELLYHYLADLGNSCEDMLLRCHFEGR